MTTNAIRYSDVDPTQTQKPPTESQDPFAGQRELGNGSSILVTYSHNSTPNSYFSSISLFSLNPSYAFCGSHADIQADPFDATGEDKIVDIAGPDEMSISQSAPQHKDRRMSKEWDAAKVPPSRFQRREGSIYSTPASRDAHVKGSSRDKAYFDKLKEKVSYSLRQGESRFNVYWKIKGGDLFTGVLTFI